MNQTVLDAQDAVQIINLTTFGINADLYIRNITFRNGHSNGNGGGLRAESDQGLIRIDSGEFIGNTADTLGGVPILFLLMELVLFAIACSGVSRELMMLVD